LPRALDDDTALYVSNRQYVRGASFFLLRTTGEPTELASAVRAAVSEIEPQLEPMNMRTLEENFGSNLQTPRFNALLVTLFAVIALVLGAAGIYGVVAYTVALRSREIGIRMALGAARREVLRSVLSEGFRLTGIGLVVGLVGAFFFIRLLQGLLHGVRAADPWALVGTVVVLGLTSLAASVVPALRASRTDPVRALRSE
jgi:ABC-type antimicrobial peptide transport system permease subunit